MNYKYRAICTSDICIELVKKRHAKKTRVNELGMEGAIKLVPKTAKQCPHCNYYLFWDRYIK